MTEIVRTHALELCSLSIFLDEIASSSFCELGMPLL
jgi:hypothetical protein